MKIAFVGYGSMTQALAGRWAESHRLFIGGRDAAKAKKLADELGAQSGSAAEAVAFGEAVVLATPHDAVFDAVESAGGPAAFAGKVVIDINNPVADFKGGDFLVKSYGGKSLAEAIQDATGARVVKAFNMCQAKVWAMDPPLFDGRKLVTLYCGDDADANRAVAGLIAELGSEPVEVGELRYARLLEPAAALVIKFLVGGGDPRTVLNLIRPEFKPVA